MCFSNLGKVYWLGIPYSVGQPQFAWSPDGQLAPLDEGERITSILPIDGYDDKFIFMATEKGTVKKTAATQFARQRSVGLRAIELDEDDVLVGTAVTDGISYVVLRG